MARIRLRTLTPIHVGSGTEELISGIDYLKAGNITYILNKDRLYRVLLERNLFDRFLTGIDSTNKWLEEFMYKEGLLKQKVLEDICLYRIHTGGLSPKRIRPFIRDAFGRAFLPGSSIKGFLRSSLIYSIALLTEPQTLERRFFDSLRELENRKYNVREQAKRIGNFLEDELSNFFIPYASEKPHRDIFRTLLIKDSLPIKDEDIQVYEVRNIKKSGEATGFYTFIEAIKPGVEIELDTHLKDNILKTFSSTGKKLLFSNLRDILNMAQQFGNRVMENEISFFSQSEQLKNVVYTLSSFRSKLIGKIGWGTGLEGTSVFSALPPKVKREIKRRFYRVSDNRDFPETRRVVFEREKPSTPLGWVEFSLED
ncbi:hypothetical protein HRbin37_00951 [bacterium HR37]|nr:hypothetical protein HRbin37_00951 [bacterium HR37]